MSLNLYVLINFVNMELFNSIATVLRIQTLIPEEYLSKMLKPMTTQ